MLRKLCKVRRPLSYANVMSTVAVFGVLAGGTAYAANTIGSADIVDGQVKSVDVANQDLTSSDIKDGSLNTFDLTDGTGVASADIINNAITNADIKDGSLKDEDLAKSARIGVPVDVGSVVPQTCKDVFPSAAVNLDHVVLTPEYGSASDFLTYTAQTFGPGILNIKVCNPTGSAIDDGVTYFNVLVIDGQ